MLAGPFNIALLAPPNYPHAMAFREVAVLLSAAFQTLGIPATFHLNKLDPNATNIILAYHLIQTPSSLAGIRYIPYQLEQFSPESPFITPRGIEILKNALEVWDYSPQNLPALLRQGIGNVRLLPLAYHEKLELIPPPASVQDIDVLHYGSMNYRRALILDELKKHCRLHCVEDVYGEKRDDLVARAKLVLSIHYYSAKIAAQVRISYLLNNRRAVVAETSEHDPFPDMTAAAAYDQLTATCLRLLADDAGRAALAERGYRLFKQRHMAENLRKVLAR